MLNPSPVQPSARLLTERSRIYSITHQPELPPDPNVLNIAEPVAKNISFIAVSPLMHNVRAQAETLAKVDVPILIVGESGSGKKLIGRLIHNLSSRSAHKFLKVSCAALEPNAFDGEFFDHVKERAFEENGRESNPFVRCHKGTLLLEDIDELEPRAQARLVCLLQDKLSSSSRENGADLDVRIIATTKLNTPTALLDRKLRKDLYYCLSAFTVAVPPLRQRREEIPFLLKHFMDRVSVSYGLPVRDFSPKLISDSQRYFWPGNLEELEKFVKRYAVSGESEAPWQSGEAERSPKAWNQCDIADGIHSPMEPGPEASAHKSLLHSAREEAERNAIAVALEQTRWNRKAAARLLNVSYRTLLYKIQQYDMNPLG